MKADLVQLLLYGLVLFAIVSFVFRDQYWLRGMCVVASLACVCFASMHLTVSSRMAGYRLEQEGKSYREATFADGSRYSTAAAQTSIPLFFTATTVLAAFALIPPKAQSRQNHKSRSA
ncbi:MAG: hypothetical protein QOE70_2109 [Chthoniobacter sp.]|jgi:hypothetical protein|nr:hypothetical protein [Chthoniobacter sp.]